MLEKCREALGSMRFWYLVVALVAFFLKENGIISEALMLAVFGFAGISIGVRTIDKAK